MTYVFHERAWQIRLRPLVTIVPDTRAHHVNSPLLLEATLVVDEVPDFGPGIRSY
jgi:hypothetical protein